MWLLHVLNYVVELLHANEGDLEYYIQWRWCWWWICCWTCA